MDDRGVRIARLAPMRVACATGFGTQPETEAWNKLLKWAGANGLLDQPHRFFGFNNPNPVPGSPNYGYEQWMEVDSGARGDENVEIKEFDGGLYAVLRCDGLTNIGEDWGRLVAWAEAAPYVLEERPGLEELLTPPDLPHESYIFDLYLAIMDR